MVIFISLTVKYRHLLASLSLQWLQECGMSAIVTSRWLANQPTMDETVINQSINPLINHSINQSINYYYQSINHYIKSMINQLIDAWFCINSLRASRTRPMTFNLFTSQFLGISRGLTVYDLLSVVRRDKQL